MWNEADYRSAEAELRAHGTFSPSTARRLLREARAARQREATRACDANDSLAELIVRRRVMAFVQDCLRTLEQVTTDERARPTCRELFHALDDSNPLIRAPMLDGATTSGDT